MIATVHHRHAHTSHHGSTVPDSLVLVTVGDTPPEGRVAVVDTGNTVGVIRTPAPAGLDTLLIACHTSSIWEWEWKWEWNENGNEDYGTLTKHTCKKNTIAFLT